MKGFLAGRSPFFQFFFLIVLWFLCYTAVNMLLAAGLISFYGLESVEAVSEKLLSGSLPAKFLKMMQIFMSLGAFLVPAIMFAYFIGDKPAGYLGATGMPAVFLILLCLFIVLSAAPFIFSMLELNQKMQLPSFLSQLEQFLFESEKKQEAVLKSLLQMHSWQSFVLNFIMVAIIPALAEEFFFRGAMLQVLTSLYRNVHLAVFMTAIVFSFIHFQFYGFLPRLFLGILFGYLFVWSGNIWYPVAAHLFHNGAQVVVLYLYQKNVTRVDIEAETSIPPMLALGATAICFYLLSVFYKNTGSKV